MLSAPSLPLSLSPLLLLHELLPSRPFVQLDKPWQEMEVSSVSEVREGIGDAGLGGRVALWGSGTDATGLGRVNTQHIQG